MYKGKWKGEWVAIKAIPDVRRFCQEVGVVRILNRNAGDRDLFQHCIRYYGTPLRPIITDLMFSHARLT